MKKYNIPFIMFMLLNMISVYAFAQGRKTRNIIVVTVDGCRWQEVFHGADSALLFSRKYNTRDSAWLVNTYWSPDVSKRRKALMPFFWNTIAKHGQLYGNRDFGNKVDVKNPYWISYPGYSELLTGYVDPEINSNSYPDNPNINVLEFINSRKGFKGKVASFASWGVLAKIINRDRNGLLVNIPYEKVKGPHLTPMQREANHWQNYIPAVFGSGERLDGATYAIMKAYVETDHPRVVYLDFGDTDDYAHRGRYDYYIGAIHYVDAMLGDLWNYIQHDPFYKNKTTILISPDHGRGVGNKWTGHGSEKWSPSHYFPHSGETWLAVMGPDTPPTGMVEKKGQIYQEQYARSIAGFLGLDFTTDHPVAKPVKSLMR